MLAPPGWSLVLGSFVPIDSSQEFPHVRPHLLEGWSHLVRSFTDNFNVKLTFISHVGQKAEKTPGRREKKVGPEAQGTGRDQREVSKTYDQFV